MGNEKVKDMRKNRQIDPTLGLSITSNFRSGQVCNQFKRKQNLT